MLFDKKYIYFKLSLLSRIFVGGRLRARSEPGRRRRKSRLTIELSPADKGKSKREGERESVRRQEMERVYLHVYKGMEIKNLEDFLASSGRNTVNSYGN